MILSICIIIIVLISAFWAQNIDILRIFKQYCDSINYFDARQ